MSARHEAAGGFAEIAIHPKFALAALWTSVMFCYVYGDIFEFFRAEMLRALLAGRTPVGPTTQTALLLFSIMMAVPSLMICLTLLLPARASRALNLATGLLYTAIIAVTGLSGWSFILFLSLVEMALTALIVGTAWRWPRRASAG